MRKERGERRLAKLDELANKGERRNEKGEICE